ncbi:hypothetical protein B0H10DRAFT_2226840 [Mycena sp. CBHHK59/15]|nr:hypothetical protein B0H10DRAFT_2226840 [Mycena sp. CBHHK59/15]
MADPNVRRYTLTDPVPDIQVTDDDAAEGANLKGGHRDSTIRRAPAVRYPRSLHTDPTEKPAPSAIETGYAAAFAPTALPARQAVVDALEDKLGAPTSAASDAYEKLNTFYTANAAVISTAGSALASAANLDVAGIEHTITTFAETSAVLMKGLDALGQLHPFVGVAVTAFKLVITLDITRRQNNKKVLVVKIQMQDLMTILFQLRHMRDPADKGPDGTTLRDRLQGRMEAIAKDITACGSACDVYMKKSFLAKTIKSKIYEGRLAGYVASFATHKQEIGFALKVHTALGVDAANRKLDAAGAQLQSADAHLRTLETQMDALFRRLDTPRERDAARLIADKGGARAVVESDGALTELLAKSGEASGAGEIAAARKALSRELAEDVDAAFARNATLFDRKLEMQGRQLEDAMTETGRHIISVLSAGAHEKIMDADLQAIWKDMGWKGSVKARYFVLALNDYYTEKFSSSDEAHAENVAASAAASAAGSAPVSPTSPTFDVPMSPAFSEAPTSVALPDGKPADDRWALAYVNVAHLQPILEAVDDDGTGFVSIKEANDFAMSRPEGWSLLSWVAFWAAGWHASVTWYKNRIYNLLQTIASFAGRVHAANRRALDTYYGGPAMRRVELLLRSTRSAPGTVYDDPRLRLIADAFRTTEADHLQQQLEGLLYELDDTTTLRLLTGPRRIERYVYPLVFRLLKRHFDVIRLGCKHVLDEAEFETMSGSLATVFKAIDERTRNLESIFIQTQYDVKARFGNFAFGMFQSTYGEYSRDPINNTITAWNEEDGFRYNDEDLGPDSDDDEEEQAKVFGRLSLDMLRYPVQDGVRGAYDFAEHHPPPAVLADPLDGVWTGHLYEVAGGKWASQEGMLSLVLTRTGDKLAGAAENFLAVLDVQGTVGADNAVELVIKWPDGWAMTCTGRYDPATDTIRGENWSGEDTTASDDESSESGSSEESDSSESGSSDGNEDDETETKDDAAVETKDDAEEGSEEDEEGSGSEDGSRSGDEETTDGKPARGALMTAINPPRMRKPAITQRRKKDTDGSESTSSSASDDTTYPWVFRRTPPHVDRCRYTNAHFTENPARARWGFAIAAVLHDIRRTRCSWPYLKERFAERRRFMELRKKDKITIDKLSPWASLDDDETAELYELKGNLRSGDSRFYTSLVDFQLQHLVNFGRDCDACSRHITETRVFCIQCVDSVFYDLIDLCIECMDQTPERDGFVHTSSHVVMKITRVVHDGELAWAIPEARAVADRAKDKFKAAASLLSRIEGGGKASGHGGNTKTSESQMLCCCCGKPVSLPCWVCVDCNDEPYICMDCDTNKVPALPKGPCPNHVFNDPLILVRNTDPVPEPVTTDARVAELETKLSGLDSKMAALEEKLESHFGTLETMLTRLSEQLVPKT